MLFEKWLFHMFPIAIVILLFVYSPGHYQFIQSWRCQFHCNCSEAVGGTVHTAKFVIRSNELIFSVWFHKDVRRTEHGTSECASNISVCIEEDKCTAYGDIGRKVQKKCDHIVANNPDLKTVENIRDIIVGDEVDMERTFAQHAMYFKFAPVTSVEVERSFSKLNMLLTEYRLSIKTENVKKFLLISCNR